jgi:hypothetical protein
VNTTCISLSSYDCLRRTCCRTTAATATRHDGDGERGMVWRELLYDVINSSSRHGLGAQQAHGGELKLYRQASHKDEAASLMLSLV